LKQLEKEKLDKRREALKKKLNGYSDVIKDKKHKEKDQVDKEEQERLKVKRKQERVKSILYMKI
jgi:hypothetical protein